MFKFHRDMAELGAHFHRQVMLLLFIAQAGDLGDEQAQLAALLMYLQSQGGHTSEAELRVRKALGSCFGAFRVS